MENQNFIDVQPKEECKQCKKKPLTSYKTFITVISVYLLLTSIIGSIELYKFVVSLF